jgi:hypothetical protein
LLILYKFLLIFFIETHPHLEGSLLINISELDSWTLVSHSISTLGIFVALLLLITGVRIIIGPCQLTPHCTDSRVLKRAIKVCTLWCTLEFLRFIILLLGLSIRLMVFSLLAFDELTNMEIAKQATVLIPLTSSLTAMATTAKLRRELEIHRDALGVIPVHNFFDQHTQYAPM